MTQSRGLSGALALFVAFALGACDSKDTTVTPGPGEGAGTVILQFDHLVGAAPLELNAGTYTNAAGNEYSVSKLEYVVSDFVLELETTARADSDYVWEGIHYRTDADSTTRSLVFEDVPAGDYGTLTFVHGIVGSKNVTGAFPELDTLGMAWPAMQGGGYHYMRNEGAFTPTGGGTANFTTHTGPTAGIDYSIPVQLVLPAPGLARHGFVLGDGDTLTVRLAMDVNQWYTAPNDYDFNDYAGIMGNSAAQILLQANGATVWSIAEVTTN